MPCLGSAPTTTDDWFAIIDRCATAAAGADWASQAMLGLQAVILLAAVALLVGALVVRAGR